MASLTTALLHFSVLVGVFAISATARPCKTIFFITSSSSSSSSSYYPTDLHHLGNPNFALQNPSNSPRLTFFITEIHEFHRTRSSSRPLFNDRVVESSSDDVVASKPYYSSSSSSSIRDRTMDIMSIVGALLFGVGCGALTAATMYLIWSLFSNRRLDFGSDSDEDEFDDEDDVTPRKNGYASIPAATKAVPPTAEEVEAMK